MNLRTPGRTAAPRSVVLAAASAALALALAACGTGQNWVEEGLDPAGNGVQATVGSLQVQNVTLVQGPEGSKSVALVASLLNRGTEPDALIAATLGANPAADGTISGAPVALLPGDTPTRIGYNADHGVSWYGVEAPVSSYQSVTLKFEKSGTVTVKALIGPATGYYEGIAPAPSAT
jgi:copper(I)-binding protein